MATFTPGDNETLDTTPHPILALPPSHPKAVHGVPSKEYLLSYLSTRTPPLLRPCRQPYTHHDYSVLPHLRALYATLTPRQQLSVHLLFPASVTQDLLTRALRTGFARVLTASRRRACGELPGSRDVHKVIRVLLELHAVAGIDARLAADALGEQGLRQLVASGEDLGEGGVLENGLTDVEMVRGMGGLVRQAMVGAVVERRDGFVRVEREAGAAVGQRIGKYGGARWQEIGEGVDVDGTLRRLAISEALERDGLEDVLDAVGGIYDDDVDDAVLEGESGARGAEREVVDEPVERRGTPGASGASGAGGESGESGGSGVGRGGGRGRGRGRGRGGGRGRGRGRGGGRGQGDRRNAATKKQSRGMGMS